MAVQKRRMSSAKRDSRRAQWMASVPVPNVSPCPHCGVPRATHRVCLACGFYNGRKVLEVKSETE